MFIAFLQRSGINPHFIWARRREDETNQLRWEPGSVESLPTCRVTTGLQLGVLANVQRDDFQRLAFWLHELVEDPRWFAYIRKLIARNRGWVVDHGARRFRAVSPNICAGRKNAYMVGVDRDVAPDLYREQAELRWTMVNEAAMRHGGKLPHLLEGQRFSVNGVNFVVRGFWHSTIYVGPLNERGELCGGMDLRHEIDWQPPIANPAPLPRGARSVMYTALNALGDLGGHLASKPDPE